MKLKTRPPPERITISTRLKIIYHEWRWRLHLANATRRVYENHKSAQRPIYNF